MKRWWIALSISLAAGCAHSTIKGTTVRDTEENREVFQVIEELRSALEARDAGRVLALVSPTYFEDLGTVDAADDYGYQELRDEVLPGAFAATREMHVAVEVHDIVVEDGRAYADVRYASRAHIELPSGAFWDSHKEFNRIELQREDGQWRVISGL